MEIYYKLIEGIYVGEFHTSKPDGYITKDEVPTIIEPEEVPSTVTAIQFLVQLKLEGISEANIISIINTLPEPNKTIALVSFQRATYFERDNPLLLLVGQAFRFNDDKLDEIFINAKKLV